MYWRMEWETEAPPETAALEGRFVLHRHRDNEGPHLDLRLERDGYLLGWRIDAEELENGVWAVDKPPHPAHWLDSDGPAVREDAGGYAWLERGEDGDRLLLRGSRGARVLRVGRVQGLPARCVRELRHALAVHSAEPGAAARLIADGVHARRRAVERLCGLGRELDGAAFDAEAWRALLAQKTLAEVETHLRAYEVRFDGKYPPQPVSQPAPLDAPAAEPEARRAQDAWAILRN